MAKTGAAEKGQRKTAAAAGKYRSNVQGAGNRWAEGVAKSEIGVTPGPTARANYEAGVSQGAGNFESGVQGKGQKWLENTRRGLSY